VVQARRVAAPRARPSNVTLLGDALERPDAVAAWSVRLFLPLASISIQLSSAALVPLIAVAAFTGFVVLREAPPVRLSVLLSLPLVALAAFAEVDWVIGGYQRPIVVGCCAIWIIVCARASGMGSLTLVRALLDSAALYLLASIALHWLGFPRHSPRIASPASTIGGGARVQFPLDAGLTTPPAVAAVYLTGLAMDIRRPRSRTVLGWTAIAVLSTLYVLVEANGRAAIVATVLALYLGLLAPTFLAVANKVLVPLLIATPFWWLAIQSRVARPMDRIGGAIPLLKRHSALPLDTFEGRTYVWRAIYDHISSLPAGHLLFGWGPDGQLTSHISRFYQQYFLYTSQPATAPAQSTILQQLLDAGVIGAVVLLIVATLTAWRLGRRRLLPDAADRRALAIGTVVLFALAATASVDATLAPATPRGPFWIFAVLAGFFLATPQSKDSEAAGRGIDQA
jgi:O-antigen ligase/polysaccharide polymerase Wzy-like membrane protein